YNNFDSFGLDVDEHEPEEDYDVDYDFEYFDSQPASRVDIDGHSSGSFYTPSQDKESRIVPMLESKRLRLIQQIKNHPNYKYASFKKEGISRSEFWKLKKEVRYGPGFKGKLEMLDQTLYEKFIFSVSSGAII